MVQLRNNFDGGTTGTVITTSNSGASGGDAFDYVQKSSSTSTLAYADSGALGLNRGTTEFVMSEGTGSVASCTNFVGWRTAFGTQSQYWARFYLYFSNIVTNSTHDTNLFSSYLTSGLPGVSVFLSTDAALPYQLYIWNGYSSTYTQMTTVMVPSTWYRVEFRATLSTTVGTSDLYLYAGADADTPVVTEHVVLNSQNFGTATVNTVTIGQDYGYSVGQANTPVIYYSNFEVNTTGYPGPAPFRPGKGCPGILSSPVAIHSDVS